MRGRVVIVAATVAFLATATTVAGGSARDATAGTTVRMVVGISVEKIMYASGSADSRPPFEPVRAGDQVYVRVNARHASGPPLPPGQAQIRVLLPSAAATGNIVVAGRQGVKRCTRIEGTVVSCPITRKLRESEVASILLRLTVPQGVGVEALRFRATVAGLAEADVGVRAKQKSTVVFVYGFGPWTGRWTWKATWDTGSFTGTGMRIYQPPGSNEICAEWDWAGGGEAWGYVTGNSWSAEWVDGYGHGGWTLTLQPDRGRFTGSQSVIASSILDSSFHATIVGEQTDDAPIVLDCAEIREEGLFRR